MISFDFTPYNRDTIIQRVRTVLDNSGYNIWRDYRIITYPNRFAVDSFLGKEHIDLLLAIAI